MLERVEVQERQTATASDGELRLSEVLSGLSYALDITEGQPRGHSERTCLIGMRIATMHDLDEDVRSSLFYALLLKDAGCSSNAARVAALFGADDAAVKSSRRLVDGSKTTQSILHIVRNAGAGGSLRDRGLRAAVVIKAGRSVARSLVELRCQRGAQVARSIGLGEVAARAIIDLDEHWDGSGYPAGISGEQISLAGRVLCLAQTAEVYWHHGGPDAACEIARRRRGTWFDPSLVDTFISLKGDARFWRSLEDPEVTPLEPAEHVLVADDYRLDRVAHAFASIVDAKSPYTAHHSEGVAELSMALATSLELQSDTKLTLYRAALLHDIGKLGVSNRILDKPGPLTALEWETVRRHPRWSSEILARVGAFRDVARIAGAHHERLDGSGYHLGLAAGQLDRPARILAIADVAEALSAERPYRHALSPAEVLEIMRPDAGRGFDPDALAVLGDALHARAPRTPPTRDS